MQTLPRYVLALVPVTLVARLLAGSRHNLLNRAVACSLSERRNPNRYLERLIHELDQYSRSGRSIVDYRSCARLSSDVACRPWGRLADERQ
jgi:hypothetical protein